MNESSGGSTHTAGDLIYDAFIIGGVGGSIVAMFFLAFDALVFGQPLFTPSLMGSVLFEGMSANSVQTVSMNAVTKYTLVHFLSFGVLGIALSFLTHQAEIRARHPLVVILLAFVVLEVGFWAGTAIMIPGVIHRIGLLPVAAANLLAAVGIGLYLVSSHRPDLWARFLGPTGPRRTNRD
jgi:hypothetical protein